MRVKTLKSKVIYWLFNSATQRFEKSYRMPEAEALEANAYFAKHNMDTRWITIAKPDLNGKHVASLRSICETFPSTQHPNGKKPHCVCGEPYDAPCHFTTKEYDNLTPVEKLAANNDLV